MTNTCKGVKPRILRCNCKNEFQDERYGKGLRLHNACNDGHRCTVCLDEKHDTHNIKN